MTDEQWHEVKGLFTDCLDSSADRREQLLNQERISSEVREETKRLLEHFDAVSSGFLAPLHIDEAPLLMPDECLADRFRIVRFLGRGGMGEVYEALDQHVNDAVALKLIRATEPEREEYLARFRRELQLARRVTHPNVCRVYDLNRQQLSWGMAEFITMELLQGETLAAMLKRRPSFSPEEALPYALQILGGLQAVHAEGIIHRDLKPSNIMVTPHLSGSTRIVLMDFGLARTFGVGADLSITRSREVIGTLGYMAPEQIAGKPVSLRTDLYAFGMVLTDMLSGGSAPEEDPTGDNIARIPTAWKNVIASCLHADPERRPASADVIAEQLKKGIAEPVPSTRRFWLAGAGATAAASLAAYHWWPASRPAFKPGSALLVAPATSSDGDAVGEQVRSVLRQSARVAVWDQARLREVASFMGKSDASSMETRDWRQVAMRDSVPFILFPSVTQVGDGISLTLRLEYLEGTPDTARSYWQESFQAADRAGLFDAIALGGRWVRSLIGESDVDISRYSARPQAVTTPSWEALQNFSQGQSRSTARDREGALISFGNAKRIDPDFTMAWMRIGDIQSQMGRDSEAFFTWEKAESASRKRPVSRREDLLFRGMVASDSADYAKAVEVYKEYQYDFREDGRGYFFSVLPLLMLGRAMEAIRQAETCENYPNLRPSALLHLVACHMYNQNQMEAEANVKKLNDAGLLTRAAYGEAIIAHAIGDCDRARDALRRAAKDQSLMPPAKATLSEAMILADADRTQDAISVLSGAAKADESVGERDGWAAKRISLAILHDQIKQPDLARKALEELRREDLGPENAGWAGVLFARFQDQDDAERKLKSIPDLPYPRLQISRLHIQAEQQFAAGNKSKGLGFARVAAEHEPRAFGSEYLAHSLELAGDLPGALKEYDFCKRAKSLQLFLTFPAPAGSWQRASQATQQLQRTRK